MNNRINKMKNKTLKVTRDQLQKFSDSRRGSDDFGSHPDFPGFEFYSDPHDGEYNSSKMSMVDYPLSLTNTETNEQYTANGGYYNDGCGEQFCDDIEFILQRDFSPVRNYHDGRYVEVTVHCKLLVDAGTEELSHDDIKKRVIESLPENIKLNYLEYSK